MEDNLNNDITESQENTEKKDKKWKRAVAFLFRWSFRSFLAVIIMFICLGISLQIPGLRADIAHFGLKIANSFLIAKIELDDLQFHSLGVIELKGVRVLTAGDTLASVKRIYADVDLLPLIGGNINVNYLILDSPNIKLLRSKTDSMWNVEKFVKPTPPSNEESGETILNLHNITLNNASIVMIDSINMTPRQKLLSVQNHNMYDLDFSNVNLKNFNLSLDAKANLKTLDFNVKLNKLYFKELNSGIELENLSLAAEKQSKNIKIKELAVKTAKNSLTLALDVQNLDLAKHIGLSEIENAFYHIKLNVDKANLPEIKQIAGFYADLSDDASVNLEGSGTLNEIYLTHLQLRTGNTIFNIKGKAIKPLERKKFRFNAYIYNSTADYSDVIKNIPPNSADAIPSIGAMQIRKIDVTGKSDSLFAYLDFVSNVGSVRGTAGIKFDDDLLYFCDMSANNVNLQKITHSDALATNINGHVKARGLGTNFEKKMHIDVDFSGNNSSFKSYYFDDIYLKATLNNAVMTLDTLSAHFPKTIDFDVAELFDNIRPELNLSASLDLRNFSKPEYSMTSTFRALNLSEISGMKDLPEYLTGDLALEGKGFDIDSLELGFSSSIAEAAYKNKFLMPFNINVDLKKYANNHRRFSIESNPLNLLIDGNFKFSNILSLLKEQVAYISEFAQYKISPLTNSEKSKELRMIEHRKQDFEPFNFNVLADVKDISIINDFLGGTNLNCNAYIDFNVDVSRSQTVFNIDSLLLRNFEVNTESSDVIFTPMSMNGNLNIETVDSVFKLNNFDLHIASDNFIKINNLLIDKPNADFSIHNDYLSFSASTIINNLFDIAIKGTTNYSSNSFDISLDSLDLNYKNIFRWTNIDKITAQIHGNSYKLNNFKVERENAETIEASGEYSNNTFYNTKLLINDFPIDQINKLAIKSGKQKDKINGTIKELKVNLNGTLERPEINVNLLTSNIMYNNINMGSLAADLTHKSQKISGSVDVYSDDTMQKNKLLNVDIISIPYNLAFQAVDNRENSMYPWNVKVNGSRIPLSFVAPFIPEIENLKGSFDVDLSISGPNLNNIKYFGNVNLNRSEFTLLANNINYQAEGSVVFDNEKITISKLDLYNDRKDLANGKASVKGEVLLEGFSPKMFDLSLTTPRLLVLNQASIKAMPQIYGNLTVSTGNNPIRFFGSLKKPYLSGDVNVLNANLIMPQTTSASATKSNAIYQYVQKTAQNNKQIKVLDIASGKTYDALESVQDSASHAAAQKYKKDEPSFADILSIDLFIKLLNTVNVNMELGDLGMLIAKIGTPDLTVPVNFVMKPGEEPKMSGEIVVQEGSKLSYFTQFDTKGSITFPTGILSNPSLNLDASYAGKSYINDIARDYKVNVKITGTKERPAVGLTYTINDQDAKGDSSMIAQDAMLLIAFGKTKAEMESGNSSGNNSDFSSLGMHSLSSIFSKTATDLLKNTGYVQSAEIELGNGDLQTTRVKLSGQLFNRFVWKVSSNVTDMSANNQIDIDVPLPLVIHPELLNYIILQYSATPNATQTVINRSQKEWEFKIKMGGSW